MTDKVEHQGTVVEVASGGPGAEAVIQDGQGIVFKTEDNRFGTLGADGFYHGYVPSTQVRDILNGAGEDAEIEEITGVDLAMQKAKEQDAKLPLGSEAAAPTGDIDNTEDDVINVANIAPSDRDETLTPISAADTKKANETKKV